MRFGRQPDFPIVFEIATKPIKEYEAAEARRFGPEIAAKTSNRKIMETRLKKLQDDAAKAGPEDRQRLSDEASRFAIEVAEFVIPSPPRYNADDCTTERLSTLLCENDGRMAVMSPEGGVFDLMGGKYSANGAPNFEVYLKGHAGDTLQVDRVGRPQECVKAPALTIGLAVQPDVIRGLLDKPGFRGRGLLGRFLYAFPKSLIGRRKTDPSPMPDDVLNAYGDAIKALLILPLRKNEDSEVEPHVLSLEPDAAARMREFEAQIEPQLAEFGSMGSLPDWGAKLVGAVGRLAGILHMAEVVSGSEHSTQQISVECVQHAISIGLYLIEHAKAAFAEMGADPQTDHAKRILRWIDETTCDSFTKRDLHQGLRGTFKKVEELNPALTLLETNGYVRKRSEDQQHKAGRRPSPTYDVNPLWRAHNSKDSGTADRSRVLDLQKYLRLSQVLRDEFGGADTVV